jgi:hypothetical protein
MIPISDIRRHSCLSPVTCHTNTPCTWVIFGVVDLLCHGLDLSWRNVTKPVVPFDEFGRNVLWSTVLFVLNYGWSLLFTSLEVKVCCQRMLPLRGWIVTVAVTCIIRLSLPFIITANCTSNALVSSPLLSSSSYCATNALKRVYPGAVRMDATLELVGSRVIVR